MQSYFLNATPRSKTDGKAREKNENNHEYE